jgi:hypothetical protein
MALRSLEQFEHPAWRALAGALVGYTIVLAIILVALFVIPYLLYGLV